MIRADGNTRADAELAVRCRRSAAGLSWCRPRRGRMDADPVRGVRIRPRTIRHCCMVQIEHQDAVENIEAIRCARDRWDVHRSLTYLIQMSMGPAGQLDHPRMVAARNRVLSATLARGLTPGIDLSIPPPAGDSAATWRTGLPVHRAWDRPPVSGDPAGTAPPGCCPLASGDEVLRAIISDFDGVILSSLISRLARSRPCSPVSSRHASAMLADHHAHVSDPRLAKFRHFVTACLGIPESIRWSNSSGRHSPPECSRQVHEVSLLHRGAPNS